MAGCGAARHSGSFTTGGGFFIFGLPSTSVQRLTNGLGSEVPGQRFHAREPWQTNFYTRFVRLARDQPCQHAGTFPVLPCSWSAMKKREAALARPCLKVSS